MSTQASIWPEDAVLSETYVPKDVDHPGTPAQVSLVTSATSSSIFLSCPCLHILCLNLMSSQKSVES